MSSQPGHDSSGIVYVFPLCLWQTERVNQRMLGLGRPRLKGRPSLLDLIAHGAVSRLSSPSPSPSSTSATPLDDRPPLPASPTNNSNSNSNSSSPLSFDNPAITPTTPAFSPSPSPVMAPSGKQEAGEDQHGSIFSVSGPVIVAENMIGCAMYELVSKRTIAAWEL